MLRFLVHEGRDGPRRAGGRRMRVQDCLKVGGGGGLRGALIHLFFAEPVDSEGAVDLVVPENLSFEMPASKEDAQADGKGRERQNLAGPAFVRAVWSYPRL